MSVVIVTGSGGLIGFEACKFFHERGLDVVGVDNNQRREFFGKEGSVRKNIIELMKLPRYKHNEVDIRSDLSYLFKNPDIISVVHTAAQPSHDWAFNNPKKDFQINAVATLNLLEMTRKFCPQASFVFMSTNKVYGDTPNKLSYKELPTRWQPVGVSSFDETLSIDSSLHSLFGVSKASADLLVQEYGRYFDMNTVCFRGGCLTGSHHAGVELHGFLSYLIKCAKYDIIYKLYGFKGKQVRDNIHSSDVVNAIWQFILDPKKAAVYNIGGGVTSNCSILEAIDKIERRLKTKINLDYITTPRRGDHIWWISDNGKFMRDYSNWRVTKNIDDIIETMI